MLGALAVLVPFGAGSSASSFIAGFHADDLARFLQLWDASRWGDAVPDVHAQEFRRAGDRRPHDLARGIDRLHEDGGHLHRDQPRWREDVQRYRAVHPERSRCERLGQLNATNGKKKGPTTASLALTGAGAVSGHVYWANFTTDTIGRADLNGQNANPSFIGTASSYWPAVDGNYVYWTNYFGGVGRADLNGQNANQSFITGTSGTTGLAVGTG